MPPPLKHLALPLILIGASVPPTYGAPPPALEAFIHTQTLTHPALSEADRRYLEALSAQAQGDTAASAEALKALKALVESGEGYELQEQLQDLTLRQALLTLGAQKSGEGEGGDGGEGGDEGEGGEGADPWETIKDILDISHLSAPYAPPSLKGEAVSAPAEASEVTVAQLSAAAQAALELEGVEGVQRLSPAGVLDLVRRPGRLAQRSGEARARAIVALLSASQGPLPAQSIELLGWLSSAELAGLPLERLVSREVALGLLGRGDLSAEVVERLARHALSLARREASSALSALAVDTAPPLAQLSREGVAGEYLDGVEAALAGVARPLPHYAAAVQIARISLAMEGAQAGAQAETQGVVQRALRALLSLGVDERDIARAYRRALLEPSAEAGEAGGEVPPLKGPQLNLSGALQALGALGGEALSEEGLFDLISAALASLARAGEGEGLSGLKGLLSDDLLARLWGLSWVDSGGSLDDPRLRPFVRSGDLALVRGSKRLAFEGVSARLFRRDEEVRLPVIARGAPSLRVRVYALNALAALTRGAPLDLDLDLSGLRPNATLEYPLNPAPHITSRVEVSAPVFEAPGVYLVEVVAGELKARALVRKGALFAHTRLTASGVEALVLDERGEVAQGAAVVMEQRTYSPNKEGWVPLPFARGGRASVWLTQGALAEPATLELPAEDYRLSVSLIAPQLAGGRDEEVLARASLHLGPLALPLSLLQKSALTLQLTGPQGEPRQWVVEGPRFVGGELTQVVRLPVGFRALSATLSGEVEGLSSREPSRLSATSALTRNQDSQTDVIEDLTLERSREGSAVRLVGRQGEGIGQVALTLSLTHRLLREPLSFSRVTDAEGRVRLPGDLSDLTALHVSSPRKQKGWELVPTHTRSLWGRLTARAGEGLTLAWADPSPLSLSREGVDHSGALSLEGGVLRVAPLSAGRYELRAHSQSGVSALTLIVTPAGARAAGGALVDASALLSLAPPRALALEAPTVTPEGGLRARALNASPRARLHVVASALALDEPLWRHARIWAGADQGPLRLQGRPSLLGQALELSYEERYLLERRDAPPMVGNLYPAPSLLVHRAAEGEVESEAFGGLFGAGMGGGGMGYGAGAGRMGAKSMSRSRGGLPTQMSADRSWDYLQLSARRLWSLPLSEGGEVEVSAEQLKGLGVAQLLLVDGEATAYQEALLSGGEAGRVDLRARTPEVPEGQVRVLTRAAVARGAREPLALPSITSEWRAYASLKDVYELAQRLSGEREALERLAPLLRWPSLSDEERVARYAELAGHEANLFIYHKDRAFFDRVVRPLLNEKVALDFMDEYLLGRPLNHHLAPHRYEALNTLERVLLHRSLSDGEGESKRLRARIEASPPSAAELRALFTSALARSLDAASEPAPTPLSALPAPMPAMAPPPPPPGAPMPMEMESVADVAADKEMAEGGDDGVLEKRLERRALMQVYVAIAQTQRWRERAYLTATPPARLEFKPNAFWADYAAHGEGAPFVSPSFPQALSGASEAWLALAVLDLPFEASQPSLKGDEKGVWVEPSSTALMFYEGERAVERPADQVASLRRVYAPASALDGGKDPMKVGWRKGVPYESKLLITNPQGEALTLDAYAPLPNGALPLGQSARLKSERVRLEGYQTAVLSDLFYFPQEGDFSFPAAYIAQGDEVVGVSDAPRAEVRRELSVIDTTSWPEVARLGDEAQVLTYLEGANLHSLDLSLIYNRLPSRPFYERLAALLESARAQDGEVWSYALHHKDERRAREHVMSVAQERLGPYFEAGALRFDARDRRHLQHYDLDPLVPARAHVRDALPMEASEAATPALFEAHVAHLTYLAHKPRAAWTFADRAELVYLLLKWGRVSRALEVFKGISAPAEGEGRLVYDYLDAYLSAYTLEVDHMREVAGRYAAHPHPEWRERFAALVSEEDYFVDVNAPEVEFPQESLSSELRGHALHLKHSELREVTINAYPIDIEALFSASPEAADATQGVAPLITPEATLRVALAEGVKETTVELPEGWREGARLIEVRAKTHEQTHAYTPQRFDVEAVQSMGLLRVRAEGAPQPGVYVKVYRRMQGGQVEIHKDGYTDHRGRFDYVSAHPSPAVEEVERFLLLVLTKDRGARLLSLPSPQRG